jgi:hypothetical protein
VSRFAIDERGFTRDGERWFPVGFDYHPSYAGCEYWSDWRPDRIEADLRAMRERGFDAVRFFVFWRDVEPAAGRHDATVLGRVAEFARLADRHGLACVPSLLTIWMNGRLLDLPWRGGRGLWRDPEIADRAAAYVQAVAGALSDAPGVLAFDIGDEVIHVDPEESASLTRGEAEAWQSRMAEAIRAGAPGALVTHANNDGVLTGTWEFGPDNRAGLDFPSIHGFPVWACAAVESYASSEASLYPALAAAVAGAHGPFLVDELGCYGAGEEAAAGYVRAAAHSLLAAGTAGLIAWCWQDIVSDAPPYDARPGERRVGFLAADGRPKPAMAAFQEFAANARELVTCDRRPAQVAVYVPGGAPPSARAAGAVARHYARALAVRAHLPVELAAGELERYRLAVVPGAAGLDLDDLLALERFVRGGGTVYVSAAGHLDVLGAEDLLGVRVQDFRLVDAGASGDSVAAFEWRGTRFRLRWDREPRERFARVPLVATTDAEVLARFPSGDPALTLARRGAGRAVFCAAPFERQLDAPGRLEGAPWEELYAGLAELAGVEREVDCDSPAVELAAWADPASGAERCLAINHSSTDVRTALTSRFAPPQELVLGPKGVGLVALASGEREPVADAREGSAVS